MKILHVFDYFSPLAGGTVSILNKLTPALAQRGHQVSLYTSDYKLDKGFIADLPQVKVYPFHCVSGLGLFFVTPSLIREAREHLRDFDIVQMNCFRSFQNIVIHHYATKYKVPYVLETRGSLPRKAAGQGGYKWLLRWVFDVLFGYRILRDASACVVPNIFSVHEHSRFGAKDEKITVLPLSYPLDEFAHLPPRGQFRARYGLDSKKVVMFLGRINYIKGLDFMVESFYELSRHRQDVVLAIVGADDGYLPKLKSLVRKLNLGDRVLFTGFLSGQDKLAALVDADVFVQPSRYEQAAWAPIEAVLCGTPVIVSKGTGAAEDISKMDAGYLVTNGDKNQMVDVIESILDNPAEAKAKARHAKQYITDSLKFSDRVEDYERLYAQCIQSNLPLRRDK